ncbi:hypothetical protein [Corallococcus sp. RDP092CA]|uniref:hypothetical protein n=1 Tax=Corallococcus sp. RDP092CA TaxID=3109369 RepID=UPI0035B453CA
MAETDDKLEAIRARHAAATKGPWMWFGYLRSHDVSLRVRRGDSVMEFKRWGMSGAQPQFCTRGLLYDASKLAVPDTTPGRGRVTDINHPDARFIAASWQDTKDLLGMVDALQARVAELTEPEALLRAAEEKVKRAVESEATAWATLRKQKAELRAALQDATPIDSVRPQMAPFAAVARKAMVIAVLQERSDDHVVFALRDGDSEAAITVGDCRTLLAALAAPPAKTKPTTPQPHGCPMGDVCPVCDEPEVSRG